MLKATATVEHEAVRGAMVQPGVLYSTVFVKLLAPESKSLSPVGESVVKVTLSPQEAPSGKIPPERCSHDPVPDSKPAQSVGLPETELPRFPPQSRLKMGAEITAGVEDKVMVEPELLVKVKSKIVMFPSVTLRLAGLSNVNVTLPARLAEGNSNAKAMTNGNPDRTFRIKPPGGM